MNKSPDNPKQDKVGAVMVIGGGIAGIQASLDLANSGQKVYLVERTPSIGGNMARLDKTFPTNDCSMCILSPKVVECGRHLNIELVTLGEVRQLTGTAGRFKAKVVRKARYVDASKCTGCGVCLEKCPTRYAPRFRKQKAEVTLSRDERRLIEELIERHGKSRTPVMRILQEVNARLRFLPENVLRYLAREFGVPISVLYRIATFYTAFSLTPRGEHLISVCTGTACHIKGAARLVDELQRELDIAVGGTTRDLRFSLETVRCLGCCSLAPVVKVGERVYGGVKPGDIPRILKEYRGRPESS
jgi:NADH:ubiquinone oxidoreductase subunit E